MQWECCKIICCVPDKCFKKIRFISLTWWSMTYALPQQKPPVVPREFSKEAVTWSISSNCKSPKMRQEKSGFCEVKRPRKASLSQYVTDFQAIHMQDYIKQTHRDSKVLSDTLSSFAKCAKGHRLIHEDAHFIFPLQFHLCKLCSLAGKLFVSELNTEHNKPLTGFVRTIAYFKQCEM